MMASGSGGVLEPIGKSVGITGAYRRHPQVAPEGKDETAKSYWDKSG